MMIIEKIIEGKSRKRIHLIEKDNNKIIMDMVNSTKDYGNLSYKYENREIVKEKRKIFLEDLKLYFSREIETPIILKPQHSNEIVIVGEEDSGKGWTDYENAIPADGLVVISPLKKILPLGVLAADCAVLLVHLEGTRIYGIFHISRKNVDLLSDILLLFKGFYYAVYYKEEKNFRLSITVSPYGVYDLEEGVHIDMKEMITKKLEEAEDKYFSNFSNDQIVIYFSEYLTTSSPGSDFFYSHHLSSINKSNEERFMSLGFLRVA